MKMVFSVAYLLASFATGFAFTQTPPSSESQTSIQVKGRIVDDLGIPLVGAKVTGTNSCQMTPVLSDEKGRFALENLPGSCTSFRIEADGHYHNFFNLDDFEPGEKKDITLVKKIEVTGRLLHDNGSVYTGPVSYTFDENVKGLWNHWRERQSKARDPWTLEVPRGTRVWVFIPLFERVEIGPFKGGESTQTWYFNEPRYGTLKVVDGNTQKPLTHFELKIHDSKLKKDGSGDFEEVLIHYEVTDEGGELRLDLDRRWSPDQIKIEMNMDGYYPYLNYENLYPMETTTIQLIPKKPLNIHLTVLNAEGQSIENAEVYYFENIVPGFADFPAEIPETWTPLTGKRNGAFVLDHFQPKYPFVLAMIKAPGYADLLVPNLRSNEGHHKVTLKKLATVSGVIPPDVLQGRPGVYLQRIIQFDNSLTTWKEFHPVDDTGRFTLQTPPGFQMLMLEKPGASFYRQITDQRFTFHVQPGENLDLGTVFDENHVVELMLDHSFSDDRILSAWIEITDDKGKIGFVSSFFRGSGTDPLVPIRHDREAEVNIWFFTDVANPQEPPSLKQEPDCSFEIPEGKTSLVYKVRTGELVSKKE